MNWLLSFIVTQLVTFAAQSKNLCHVLVDPGHGGSDLGTRTLSLTEKNLTLKYAKKLQLQLSQQGKLRTVLSRDTDLYLSPQERKILADQLDCQLFLSLHINSSSNPQLIGTEIYYGQQVNGSLKQALNEADFQDIVNSLKVNYYHNKSQKVGQILKSYLKTKMTDRPVRIGKLPLQVLNHANRPSILIEIGYLSNSNEVELLNQDVFIEHFTQSLSEALIEVFGTGTFDLK
jgi:N-acetylmuramoyl-L-alanine amidase